jgi:hypothetical protein
MTKSPARKSLRPSASVRSCARRSSGASSTTRRIARNCNWRGSRRRCRSPAWRSPTANAIPAFLKMLDRLDRCQQAAKVNQVYDDEALKEALRQDQPRRRQSRLREDGGRRGGRERGFASPRPGMRRRRKKRPGGSAQAFEKARFGEGNPRISFDFSWPGFAGFGSNLAQFGSIWIFLGPPLAGRATGPSSTRVVVAFTRAKRDNSRRI